MKIEQIYTGCLAQGAYYIESKGECAIIDPLREVEPYLKRAEKDGAKIRYVFETHFHADFVSGHLDLAAKTGADIVYGPTATPAFPAIIAKDGQEFPLGDVTIVALHTPGHTMESTCYLLRNEQGKEAALFTGDTLFIGDVGRPDLAQQATQKTSTELAGILYDSLRQKIMPLADDLVIYPAHGAGSACGKNMSRETTDTLGHQKQTNYALDTSLSRDEFVQAVLSGLTPPPGYFPVNVKMNKGGYESLDRIRQRALHPLTPHAFEAVAQNTGALILDTRSARDFCRSFIPGAINIGLDGPFAPWAGALITDPHQPILLVADEHREEEAITRLARVGLDHCIGYLFGGMANWHEAHKPVDAIPGIDAEALAALMLQGDVCIIDVRRQPEYELSHVAGATNIPLDNINEEMPHISKDKPCYVHCAAGYRSMIFVSVLRARGYRNMVDVSGGFELLKASGKFMMISKAVAAMQA